MSGRSAADHPYAETDPTGRYGRLDTVLGRGAMKVVYRAFDELEGLEVAWNQTKICDVLRSPEALERLYAEVHLLSTLNHDSIIRFLSSWVSSEKRTFNFITEMFTSGTLREYRQRYKRVDIRAVKNWARQILRGLVYLHSHDPPVIHRDLKCDNIFINGHLGQVKIGDLGLAAVLKGSQQAHSIIGTPEFMAPELYEEEYNELVDIYSFGMCMLEMLTGDYPYSECANPAQIYKKVTAGKLPRGFHELANPEAKRFIGMCLEKAWKRPSAKELLLDPFLWIESDALPPSLFAGAGGQVVDYLLPHPPALHRSMHTDVNIAGKLNPEDDSIILRVQISDNHGQHRNIYFPFDTFHDTPKDVADEMVKELEITDLDPSQIAEMIDREITALMPNWKDRTSDVEAEEGSGTSDNHHVSSPTSSRSSAYSQESCRCSAQDWFRDEEEEDDDGASRSSRTGDDDESRGGEEAARSLKLGNQCGVVETSAIRKEKKWTAVQKLPRNRSLVDLRSQLLHQKLVEEVNKRRFRTVGSVENIGFRNPYDGSGKAKNPTGRIHSGGRNSGITWGGT